jgi:hypothetical protein
MEAYEMRCQPRRPLRRDLLSKNEVKSKHIKNKGVKARDLT